LPFLSQNRRAVAFLFELRLYASQLLLSLLAQGRFAGSSLLSGTHLGGTVRLHADHGELAHDIILRRRNRGGAAKNINREAEVLRVDRNASLIHQHALCPAALLFQKNALGLGAGGRFLSRPDTSGLGSLGQFQCSAARMALIEYGHFDEQPAPLALQE